MTSKTSYIKKYFLIKSHPHNMGVTFLMFREMIFGIRAYDFFNTFGAVLSVLVGLFFVKSRINNPNIHYMFFRTLVNRNNKIVKYIYSVVLSLIMSVLAVSSTSFNWPFGELVGTGANYFGALFTIPAIMFLSSVIFLENPLKNSDITTITLPLFLVFVKIACFCQGCCYGIPWEYGLYNNHPKHPGYQVPVQLIEAGLAALLFVVLLIYRKTIYNKGGKDGTIFPLYLALYSFTRFFSEFFRNEPPVFGFLKTYQILCIIGFVAGVVLFVLACKFNKPITSLFMKLEKKAILSAATIRRKHINVSPASYFHRSF